MLKRQIKKLGKFSSEYVKSSTINTKDFIGRSKDKEHFGVKKIFFSYLLKKLSTDNDKYSILYTNLYLFRFGIQVFLIF